jgi:5-enolpyruvylshikimate-3-phosphate synthase
MDDRLLTPKVRTTTTRQHELTLTRQMIISMLRSSSVKIADDAQVTFHVPGGGDWSNQDINIDEFRTLTVTWETVSSDGH